METRAIGGVSHFLLTVTLLLCLADVAVAVIGSETDAPWWNDCLKQYDPANIRSVGPKAVDCFVRGEQVCPSPDLLVQILPNCSVLRPAQPLPCLRSGLGGSSNIGSAQPLNFRKEMICPAWTNRCPAAGPPTRTQSCLNTCTASSTSARTAECLLFSLKFHLNSFQFHRSVNYTKFSHDGGFNMLIPLIGPVIDLEAATLYPILSFFSIRTDGRSFRSTSTSPAPAPAGRTIRRLTTFVTFPTT